MKYILMVLLIALALFLSACDTDHEVSGNVGVQVEYSTPQFKQVNGINYISYLSINGFVCIALDSSTLYGDRWDSLQNQDLNRTVPYTAEESANCI